MKKRIANHTFDTHKAQLLGSTVGDSISTALFRTKSGAFFVLKYAGTDPRNPELGAIEPLDATEAQTLYNDECFETELDGAFDTRPTVHTSIELDPAVRERLQTLCRYTADGTKRKCRISMGDVIAELLDMQDTETL